MHASRRPNTDARSNDKMYSDTIDVEDPLPPSRFGAGKSRQRRKSLNSFDKLGSCSSHGTTSSPILGRRKELLRKRGGGSSRNVAIPSFDIPFPAGSPVSTPFLIKKMEASSRSHQQQRRRSSPSIPSSKKYSSLVIQKHWFLACQLAMLTIFGGAVVVYANHHISMAQHKLAESQTEKSHILTQMEWIEKRAKESIAMGIINNNNPIDLVKDSSTTGGGSVPESSKVKALMVSVQALEASLQKTSRARLEEAFPSSISHSHIEVALYLEGIPNHPLVIEVPYTQVPYTAWTWINQIRQHRWDPSTFRRVLHQAVEIAPDSPVELVAPESPIEMAPGGGGGGGPAVPLLPPQGKDSQQGDSKLQFQETSIPIDDAFVVGLKNSGEMGGLILTIHLDPYGCGFHDDEVCFGKLVDGFDSLDSAQASHRFVTIRSVQIL